MVPPNAGLSWLRRSTPAPVGYSIAWKTQNDGSEPRFLSAIPYRMNFPIESDRKVRCNFETSGLSGDGKIFKERPARMPSRKGKFWIAPSLEEEIRLGSRNLVRGSQGLSECGCIADSPSIANLEERCRRRDL